MLGSACLLASLACASPDRAALSPLQRDAIADTLRTLITRAYDLTAPGDPVARRRELVTDYTERYANPYIAAERGYIDDVIEPGRTRSELIRALKMALRKERRRSPRWHGNIPL